MGTPDFATRIIDFDRLMEGENRDSHDPDDIDHWSAVYSDMVRFKEGLLGETKAHIAEVPDTGVELGGHDVPFLTAELRRLRLGLEFWERRRKETGKPG